MAQTATLKVWWLEKFGHQPVTINKDDFDPAKHSLDEPQGESEPLPPIEETEGVELTAEPKRKAGRPKSK